MLIDPMTHTMINIDFNRKLLWDSVYVNASIDSNGVLKGKIIKKYFDLAKSLKLQSDNEDDEDNKTILVDIPEINTDSSYQLDKETEMLPLTEVSTFHYELPSAKDFYLLSPFLFSNMSKDPFMVTSRKTDIDFIANISSVV